MVAEIYGQDGNLPQALRRLTQLDARLPPARSVAEALLTARDMQYDPSDLELLARTGPGGEGRSEAGGGGKQPRMHDPRLANPQPPPGGAP